MQQPRACRAKIINYAQTQFQNPDSFTNIHVVLKNSIIHLPKGCLSKIKRGDKNGSIKIKNGEWGKYYLEELVQAVEEWGINKGLFIESCKLPNILTSLSHIKFSSLTCLNLSGNDIESIEILCQIEAPNLQRLVLSQNKITCISALRKAKFHNLISCSFGGNKIQDYFPICQLYAPKLNTCSQEHRADDKLCGSFAWIAKLETTDLQYLWVRSDKRIWQRTAQTMLERRFRKKKEITFYVGLIDGPV